MNLSYFPDKVINSLTYKMFEYGQRCLLRSPRPNGDVFMLKDLNLKQYKTLTSEKLEPENIWSISD